MNKSFYEKYTKPNNNDMLLDKAASDSDESKSDDY